MLLAWPEYKTSLPGGTTSSETDVFVLARTKERLITIAVEGKMDEDFGPLVSERLAKESKGQNTRMNFLKNCLGVTELPGTIRYQLVHRTASAIIEAERFHADAAMMIVHSFSQTHTHFNDYENFIALFDVKAERGKLLPLGNRSGVFLYSAWVVGDPKFLLA
jgi:hypothetical protein